MFLVRMFTFLSNFLSAQTLQPTQFSGWLMSFGDGISSIAVAVAQWAMGLLYWICKWLLAFLDFLQYFIQKLIGLDYWLNSPYYTIKDAIDNDLLFSFLYNETVQKTFRALCGVGLVLLIVFTIFAIIRSEWQYIAGGGNAKGNFGDGSNSKVGVIRSAIKAIVLVIIFPMILLLGVISSNAILASIVKALNIDTGSTFGSSLFSISAQLANRYRNYADGDARNAVTDTVEFYIDSNDKYIYLSDSGVENDYQKGYTKYTDYLKAVSNSTKYTVNSMFDPVDAGMNDSFSGYCIGLDVDGVTKYYLVKCNDGNKNDYRYYLNNVLRVQVMTKTNSIGNSSLWKSLKSKMNASGYISGYSFDGKISKDLLNAAKNTWGYLTIFNQTQTFNSTVSYTTLTGSKTTSDGFSDDSLLDYLGLNNVSDVKVMYNSTLIDSYFDGGQFGMVQLQSEYAIMADLVDFMCKNDIEIYFMNINSDFINWNYQGYDRVGSKWISGVKNGHIKTTNDIATDKGTNELITNTDLGDTIPFVVSYSDSKSDVDAGNVLYLANANASNEKDGALFIACFKVVEGTTAKYVPVINKKEFKNNITNKSATFSSSVYTSSYDGVVLVRGLMDPNYANQENGLPTYIQEDVYINNEEKTTISTTANYYYDLEISDGSVQYSGAGSSFMKKKEETVYMESLEYSIEDSNTKYSVTQTIEGEGTPIRYENGGRTPIYAYKMHNKFTVTDSAGAGVPINASTAPNLCVNLRVGSNSGTKITANYTDQYQESGGMTYFVYMFSYEGSEGYFLLGAKSSSANENNIVYLYTSNGSGVFTKSSMVSYEASTRTQNISAKTISYDYVVNNVVSVLGSVPDVTDPNKVTTVGTFSPSKFSKYNSIDAYYVYSTVNKVDVNGVYAFANVLFNDERIVMLEAVSGEQAKINFSKPVEGSIAVQDKYKTASSIIFTFRLYNYYSGTAGGKIYEYNITGGSNEILASSVSEENTIKFLANNDYFWDYRASEYHLYNGKNYIASIYKPLNKPCNQLKDMSGVTLELLYNDKTYLNIQTQNKFDSQASLNSYYDKLKSTFITSFIRDNVKGTFFGRSAFGIGFLWLRIDHSMMAYKFERAEKASTYFQISNGVGFDYFFDGDIQLKTFYVPAKINFIVIIVSSILIIKVLTKAIWGVVKRFYEITLYYLAMPVMAATIPLEEGGGGQKFAQSVQKPLISKVLSTYGVIIGINVFFIILTPIRSISQVFTDADIATSGSHFLIALSKLHIGASFLNEFVYILFLLVAFTMIEALPDMIDKMMPDGGAAGSGGVVQSGKQAMDTAKKQMSDVGKTMSGEKAVQAWDKGKAAVKNSAIGRGLGALKRGSDKIKENFNKGKDDPKNNQNTMDNGGTGPEGQKKLGDDEEPGTETPQTPGGDTTPPGGVPVGPSAAKLGGVTSQQANATGATALTKAAYQTQQETDDSVDEIDAENAYNEEHGGDPLAGTAMNEDGTVDEEKQDAATANIVREMANGDLKDPDGIAEQVAGQIVKNKSDETGQSTDEILNGRRGLMRDVSLDAKTDAVVQTLRKQGKDKEADAIEAQLKGKTGAEREKAQQDILKKFDIQAELKDGKLSYKMQEKDEKGKNKGEAVAVDGEAASKITAGIMNSDKVGAKDISKAVSGLGEEAQKTVKRKAGAELALSAGSETTGNLNDTVIEKALNQDDSSIRDEATLRTFQEDEEGNAKLQRFMKENKFTEEDLQDPEKRKALATAFAKHVEKSEDPEVKGFLEKHNDKFRDNVLATAKTAAKNGEFKLSAWDVAGEDVQNKYREEMRQKRREGQSTSVLDGASTEEKTSIISNVSKAITKDEGLKGSALTRNIENAVFAKSVTKEDLAGMDIDRLRKITGNENLNSVEDLSQEDLALIGFIKKKQEMDGKTLDDFDADDAENLNAVIGQFKDTASEERLKAFESFKPEEVSAAVQENETLTKLVGGIATKVGADALSTEQKVDLATQTAMQIQTTQVDKKVLGESVTEEDLKNMSPDMLKKITGKDKIEDLTDDDKALLGFVKQQNGGKLTGELKNIDETKKKFEMVTNDKFVKDVQNAVFAGSVTKEDLAGIDTDTLKKLTGKDNVNDLNEKDLALIGFIKQQNGGKIDAEALKNPDNIKQLKQQFNSTEERQKVFATFGEDQISTALQGNTEIVDKLVSQNTNATVLSTLNADYVDRSQLVEKARILDEKTGGSKAMISGNEDLQLIAFSNSKIEKNDITRNALLASMGVKTNEDAAKKLSLLGIKDDEIEKLKGMGMSEMDILAAHKKAELTGKLKGKDGKNLSGSALVGLLSTTNKNEEDDRIALQRLYENATKVGASKEERDAYIAAKNVVMSSLTTDQKTSLENVTALTQTEQDNLRVATVMNDEKLKTDLKVAKVTKDTQLVDETSEAYQKEYQEYLKNNNLEDNEEAKAKFKQLKENEAVRKVAEASDEYKAEFERVTGKKFDEVEDDAEKAAFFEKFKANQNNKTKLQNFEKTAKENKVLLDSGLYTEEEIAGLNGISRGLALKKAIRQKERTEGEIDLGSADEIVALLDDPQNSNIKEKVNKQVDGLPYAVAFKMLYGDTVNLDNEIRGQMILTASENPEIMDKVKESVVTPDRLIETARETVKAGGEAGQKLAEDFKKATGIDFSKATDTQITDFLNSKEGKDNKQAIVNTAYEKLTAGMGETEKNKFNIQNINAFLEKEENSEIKTDLELQARNVVLNEKRIEQTKVSDAETFDVIDEEARKRIENRTKVAGEIAKRTTQEKVDTALNGVELDEVVETQESVAILTDAVKNKTEAGKKVTEFADANKKDYEKFAENYKKSHANATDEEIQANFFLRNKDNEAYKTNYLTAQVKGGTTLGKQIEAFALADPEKFKEFEKEYKKTHKGAKLEEIQAQFYAQNLDADTVKNGVRAEQEKAVREDTTFVENAKNQAKAEVEKDAEFKAKVQAETEKEVAEDSDFNKKARREAIKELEKTDEYKKATKEEKEKMIQSKVEEKTKDEIKNRVSAKTEKEIENRVEAKTQAKIDKRTNENAPAIVEEKRKKAEETKKFVDAYVAVQEGTDEGKRVEAFAKVNATAYEAFKNDNKGKYKTEEEMLAHFYAENVDKDESTTGFVKQEVESDKKFKKKARQEVEQDIRKETEVKVRERTEEFKEKARMELDNVGFNEDKVRKEVENDKKFNKNARAEALNELAGTEEFKKASAEDKEKKIQKKIKEKQEAEVTKRYEAKVTEWAEEDIQSVIDDQTKEALKNETDVNQRLANKTEEEIKRRDSEERRQQVIDVANLESGNEAGKNLNKFIDENQDEYNQFVKQYKKQHKGEKIDENVMKSEFIKKKREDFKFVSNQEDFNEYAAGYVASNVDSKTVGEYAKQNKYMYEAFATEYIATADVIDYKVDRYTKKNKEKFTEFATDFVNKNVSQVEQDDYVKRNKDKFNKFIETYSNSHPNADYDTIRAAFVAQGMINSKSELAKKARTAFFAESEEVKNAFYAKNIDKINPEISNEIKTGYYSSHPETFDKFKMDYVSKQIEEGTLDLNSHQQLNKIINSKDPEVKEYYESFAIDFAGKTSIDEINKFAKEGGDRYAVFAKIEREKNPNAKEEDIQRLFYAQNSDEVKKAFFAKNLDLVDEGTFKTVQAKYYAQNGFEKNALEGVQARVESGQISIQEISKYSEKNSQKYAEFAETYVEENVSQGTINTEVNKIMRIAEVEKDNKKKKAYTDTATRIIDEKVANGEINTESFFNFAKDDKNKDAFEKFKAENGKKFKSEDDLVKAFYIENLRKTGNSGVIEEVNKEFFKQESDSVKTAFYAKNIEDANKKVNGELQAEFYEKNANVELDTYVSKNQKEYDAFAKKYKKEHGDDVDERVIKTEFFAEQTRKQYSLIDETKSTPTAKIEGFAEAGFDSVFGSVEETQKASIEKANSQNFELIAAKNDAKFKEFLGEGVDPNKLSATELAEKYKQYKEAGNDVSSIATTAKKLKYVAQTSGIDVTTTEGLEKINTLATDSEKLGKEFTKLAEQNIELSPEQKAKIMNEAETAVGLSDDERRNARVMGYGSVTNIDGKNQSSVLAALTPEERAYFEAKAKNKKVAQTTLATEIGNGTFAGRQAEQYVKNNQAEYDKYLEENHLTDSKEAKAKFIVSEMAKAEKDEKAKASFDVEMAKAAGMVEVKENEEKVSVADVFASKQITISPKVDSSVDVTDIEILRSRQEKGTATKDEIALIEGNDKLATDLITENKNAGMQLRALAGVTKQHKGVVNNVMRASAGVKEGEEITIETLKNAGLDEKTIEELKKSGMTEEAILVNYQKAKLGVEGFGNLQGKDQIDAIILASTDEKIAQNALTKLSEDTESDAYKNASAVLAKEVSSDESLKKDMISFAQDSGTAVVSNKQRNALMNDVALEMGINLETADENQRKEIEKIVDNMSLIEATERINSNSKTKENKIEIDNFEGYFNGGKTTRTSKSTLNNASVEELQKEMKVKLARQNDSVMSKIAMDTVYDDAKAKLSPEFKVAFEKKYGKGSFEKASHTDIANFAQTSGKFKKELKDATTSVIKDVSAEEIVESGVGKSERPVQEMLEKFNQVNKERKEKGEKEYSLSEFTESEEGKDYKDTYNRINQRVRENRFEKLAKTDGSVNEMMESFKNAKNKDKNLTLDAFIKTKAGKKYNDIYNRVEIESALERRKNNLSSENILDNLEKNPNLAGINDTVEKMNATDLVTSLRGKSSHSNRVTVAEMIDFAGRTENTEIVENAAKREKLMEETSVSVKEIRENATKSNKFNSELARNEFALNATNNAVFRNEFKKRTGKDISEASELEISNLYRKLASSDKQEDKDLVKSIQRSYLKDNKVLDEAKKSEEFIKFMGGKDKVKNATESDLLEFMNKDKDAFNKIIADNASDESVEKTYTSMLNRGSEVAQNIQETTKKQKLLKDKKSKSAIIESIAESEEVKALYEAEHGEGSFEKIKKDKKALLNFYNSDKVGKKVRQNVESSALNKLASSQEVSSEYINSRINAKGTNQVKKTIKNAMGADEIATTEAIDGSYEKRFDDYLNTVSKNPEKVNDVVKTFYGLTSEDSINNEYEEFINKTGKNAVERDILRKKLENSGKSKEEVALAYAKIKLLNSVKGPNEQITLRSGKEVEDLFGELKKDNNNDAQVITAMKATVQKGTYTGKNNGYQITQENIENYKRVRDSYIQEIGEIAPIGEIVEETEDETPTGTIKERIERARVGRRQKVAETIRREVANNPDQQFSYFAIQEGKSDVLVNNMVKAYAGAETAEDVKKKVSEINLDAGKLQELKDKGLTEEEILVAYTKATLAGKTDGKDAGKNFNEIINFAKNSKSDEVVLRAMQSAGTGKNATPTNKESYERARTVLATSLNRGSVIEIASDADVETTRRNELKVQMARKDKKVKSKIALDKVNSEIDNVEINNDERFKVAKNDSAYLKQNSELIKAYEKETGKKFNDASYEEFRTFAYTRGLDEQSLTTGLETVDKKAKAMKALGLDLSKKHKQADITKALEEKVKTTKSTLSDKDILDDLATHTEIGGITEKVAGMSTDEVLTKLGKAPTDYKSLSDANKSKVMAKVVKDNLGEFNKSKESTALKQAMLMKNTTIEGDKVLAMAKRNTEFKNYLNINNIALANATEADFAKFAKTNKGKASEIIRDAKQLEIIKGSKDNQKTLLETIKNSKQKEEFKKAYEAQNGIGSFDKAKGADLVKFYAKANPELAWKKEITKETISKIASKETLTADFVTNNLNNETVNKFFEEKANGLSARQIQKLVQPDIDKNDKFAIFASSGKVDSTTVDRLVMAYAGIDANDENKLAKIKQAKSKLVGEGNIGNNEAILKAMQKPDLAKIESEERKIVYSKVDDKRKAEIEKEVYADKNFKGETRKDFEDEINRRLRAEKEKEIADRVNARKETAETGYKNALDELFKINKETTTLDDIVTSAVGPINTTTSRRSITAGVDEVRENEEEIEMLRFAKQQKMGISTKGVIEEEPTSMKAVIDQIYGTTQRRTAPMSMDEIITSMEKDIEKQEYVDKAYNAESSLISDAQEKEHMATSAESSSRAKRLMNRILVGSGNYEEEKTPEFFAKKRAKILEMANPTGQKLTKKEEDDLVAQFAGENPAKLMEIENQIMEEESKAKLMKMAMGLDGMDAIKAKIVKDDGNFQKIAREFKKTHNGMDFSELDITEQNAYLAAKYKEMPEIHKNTEAIYLAELAKKSVIDEKDINKIKSRAEKEGMNVEDYLASGKADDLMKQGFRKSDMDVMAYRDDGSLERLAIKNMDNDIFSKLRTKITSDKTDSASSIFSEERKAIVADKVDQRIAEGKLNPITVLPDTSKMNERQLREFQVTQIMLSNQIREGTNPDILKNILNNTNLVNEDQMLKDLAKYSKVDLKDVMKKDSKGNDVIDKEKLLEKAGSENINKFFNDNYEMRDTLISVGANDLLLTVTKEQRDLHQLEALNKNTNLKNEVIMRQFKADNSTVAQQNSKILDYVRASTTLTGAEKKDIERDVKADVKRQLLEELRKSNPKMTEKDLNKKINKEGIDNLVSDDKKVSDESLINSVIKADEKSEIEKRLRAENKNASNEEIKDLLAKELNVEANMRLAQKLGKDISHVKKEDLQAGINVSALGLSKFEIASVMTKQRAIVERKIAQNHGVHTEVANSDLKEVYTGHNELLVSKKEKAEIERKVRTDASNANKSETEIQAIIKTQVDAKGAENRLALSKGKSADEANEIIEKTVNKNLAEELGVDASKIKTSKMTKEELNRQLVSPERIREIEREVKVNNVGKNSFEIQDIINSKIENEANEKIASRLNINNVGLGAVNMQKNTRMILNDAMKNRDEFMLKVAKHEYLDESGNIGKNSRRKVAGTVEVMKNSGKPLHFSDNLYSQVLRNINYSKNMSDEELKNFLEAQELSKTENLGIKNGAKNVKTAIGQFFGTAAKNIGTGVTEGVPHAFQNVLFKITRHTPQNSAYYNNWNNVIQQQISEVKQGKGAYADMGVEERKAKVEELQNKIIYTNGNKPQNYNQMTAQERLEYNREQTKLKHEAFTTTNPNYIKRSMHLDGTKRTGNKSLIDNFGATFGVSGIHAPKAIKDQHKKDLSLIKSSISEYNATKDHLDFKGNFEAIANKYLGKKSAKDVIKQANKTQSVSERQKILERAMAMKHVVASSKVAHDSGLKEEDFFEERRIGKTVVRYKDASKKYTALKSRINTHLPIPGLNDDINNTLFDIKKGIVDSYEKRVAENKHVSGIHRALYNRVYGRKSEAGIASAQARRDMLQIDLNRLEKFNLTFKGTAKEYSDYIKTNFKSLSSKLYGIGIHKVSENNAVAIQRRGAVNMLASMINQENKKLKYASNVVPASVQTSSQMVGKPLTNAKSMAKLNNDKVIAQNLNDSLNKVRNQRDVSSFNAVYNRLMPEVKAQIQKRIDWIYGDDWNTFSDKEKFDMVESFLTKKLNRANNRINNRSTLMNTGRDQLEKLNGMYIKKEEVNQGKVSGTMQKAIYESDANYKTIVERYNECSTKYNLEKEHRENLNRELIKLRETPVNSYTKKEMFRVYTEINESEIRLSTLKKSLDRAKSSKDVFEKAFADKQYASTRTATSSPSVNSKVSAFETHEFYKQVMGANGAVTYERIDANSPEGKEIDMMSRRYMGKLQSHLELMRRSDAMDAMLKEYIDEVKSKIGNSFDSSAYWARMIDRYMYRRQQMIIKENYDQEVAIKRNKSIAEQNRLMNLKDKRNDKQILENIEEMRARLKSINDEFAMAMKKQGYKMETRVTGGNGGSSERVIIERNAPVDMAYVSRVARKEAEEVSRKEARNITRKTEDRLDDKAREVEDQSNRVYNKAIEVDQRREQDFQRILSTGQFYSEEEIRRQEINQRTGKNDITPKNGKKS